MNDDQAAPRTSRSATTPRRVHLVHPSACAPFGVSGVALDLADAMAAARELREQVRVTHWVTTVPPELRAAHRRSAAHPVLARVLGGGRFGKARLRRRLVGRIARECQPGDIVLMFPILMPDDCQRLRDTGALLVHDWVNTAAPSHWATMREAHRLCGVPLQEHDTEIAAIEEERHRLHPADFAFACSPLVEESYVAFGFPREHILPSCYGWNPRRFHPVSRPPAEPTFLFAGTGCVRKGLPMLLQAWQRARIRGRLQIVGAVSSGVEQHYGRLLDAPGVQRVPFQSDLSPWFGSATAMVLPSFEEGSPLVSYLALAAGLPSILSPTAAGWVVRDGREGLVVSPSDVDALAAALRRLAEDRELHARLSAAARARADEFTWDRVAVRRAKQLARLRAT